MNHLLSSRVMGLVLVVLLAACASTNVDLQWRSLELQPGYLRGATVLVSCETPDTVLQRVCEDQVSADLSARGLRPVLAAPGSVANAQPGAADVQYLPAARANGATAVFSVTLGLASQTVSQGMMVSIGGFGFGSHSAGGLGVSAPIGGGRVSQGYAANGRVTDASSGRLMWTARASTPPSTDLNAQMAELSRSILDAAGKAGVL